MANPAVSVTGSIVLGIQALDQSNNSVIFNRQVTGLQTVGLHDSLLSSYYNIDLTPVLIQGSPLSGLYIKNQDPVAVVTVSWTAVGAGAPVNVVNIFPGGIILVYMPDGTDVVESVYVNSNTLNTPVEFAWWS